MVSDALAEEFKHNLEFTEKLIEKMPDIDADEIAETADRLGRPPSPAEVYGPRLRQLRRFLDQADPSHEWGGLTRLQTKEGHLIWVCPDHLAEYNRRQSSL